MDSTVIFYLPHYSAFVIRCSQDDDDEGEEEGAGKEGKQRPGADKRKLADAFEREKTKAQRIKELAEKKVHC